MAPSLSTFHFRRMAPQSAVHLPLHAQVQALVPHFEEFYHIEKFVTTGSKVPPKP